jgi:hypothetical protein
MPKFFSNYTVDHRSKIAMLQFLTRHARHTDSLYHGQTIANKIKLYNLGLTSEQQEIGFKYLEEQSISDWNFDLDWAIQMWREENPDYLVQITGRSSGWLELVPESVHCHSVFDQFDPPLQEDTHIEDIRELCKVVESFDLLCDDLRDIFIDRIAEYGVIIKEEAEQEAKEAAALLEPAFPAVQIIMGGFPAQNAAPDLMKTLGAAVLSVAGGEPVNICETEYPRDDEESCDNCGEERDPNAAVCHHCGIWFDD